LKKPIIAAVNGIAAGAGAMLMLASDLRIFSDKARTAFLFVKVGLSGADMGALYLLPRIVGLGKATELVYFGDTIDAPTAREMGMVNRVVPLAELSAATMKYARRLALISPEALAGTKLATRRGAEAAGFRNAIQAGLDVVAPLYAARTEIGMKFQEIKEKDGLGAALRWRAGQFAG